MKSFSIFNDQSKEKSSFIKEVFDDISSSYDMINGILSLFIYKMWQRRIIKESSLCIGGSAIDFCTGTGELLIKLCKRYKLSHAVGIDISTGMLEIAKKKIEKMDDLNSLIEFYNVPAENTGLTEKFDCATIAFALRNISNASEVFYEMRRVVKKGGKIIILELTTPDQKILKAIYKIYLRSIVPIVGYIYSRNKKAYKYLAESIINFPSSDIIVDTLEKAGLSNIKVIRLSMGASTIFSCNNN